MQRSSANPDPMAKLTMQASIPNKTAIRIGNGPLFPNIVARERFKNKTGGGGPCSPVRAGPPAFCERDGWVVAALSALAAAVFCVSVYVFLT